MNILYLDWPCFGYIDILFTFEHTFKHHVTRFFHKDYQERESKNFMDAFDATYETQHFDFCFSYNFYPVLAECCHRHNLKYISIVYDSPFVMLYSYTITYPTNYVFIFDSQLYQELKNGGIDTVYYTVLPVNSTVIVIMLKKPYNKERTLCDVSFVGTLYNEDDTHNFFDRLYRNLDSYTKGYLDAIMEAQLKISGYYFIEEILTDPIIQKLHEAEPYIPSRDGAETLSNIYANYHIGRKLTSIERVRLLSALGETHHNVKMFTLNKNVALPGVTNMGVTDYYSEMPLIFHNSKINLNITLRSIQSGIPLRCMDIMGAGGFLLTNFQADLLDYFIPDEDFVYYEDQNDLIKKVDYYLEHDEKRKQIAENGHQKVARNHSYEKCLTDIFSIVFN